MAQNVDTRIDEARLQALEAEAIPAMLNIGTNISADTSSESGEQNYNTKLECQRGENHRNGDLPFAEENEPRFSSHK